MIIKRFNVVFRRSLSYNLVIALVLIFAILIGIGVYFFYPKGFCNQENYDLFYLLKALRTNDKKLCEKIFWVPKKQRCLAYLDNSESYCDFQGRKDGICVALAKKNDSLCADDGVCHALITKNPRFCIERLKVLKDVSEAKFLNLEQVCNAYASLDAEYFISKKLLKDC